MDWLDQLAMQHLAEESVHQTNIGLCELRWQNRSWLYRLFHRFPCGSI